MNAEPLSTDGTTGREIRGARHSGTEEQFITVPELARRLGRSKESLYQAARREEIPGVFLIGGSGPSTGMHFRRPQPQLMGRSDDRDRS